VYNFSLLIFMILGLSCFIYFSTYRALDILEIPHDPVIFISLMFLFFSLFPIIAYAKRISLKLKLDKVFLSAGKKTLTHFKTINKIETNGLMAQALPIPKDIKRVYSVIGVVSNATQSMAESTLYDMKIAGVKVGTMNYLTVLMGGNRTTGNASYFTDTIEFSCNGVGLYFHWAHRGSTVSLNKRNKVRYLPPFIANGDLISCLYLLSSEKNQKLKAPWSNKVIGLVNFSEKTILIYNNSIILGHKNLPENYLSELYPSFTVIRMAAPLSVATPKADPDFENFVI
ncbi:hypothetical protein VQ643_15845, partial [Pseudomonas sp. F1_0610]|uniref:hypothetical protein n=1 Tax=Pseudomonas sp. F1_0610 TaxID=3114284 RepID=UPI0039C4745A